MDVSTHTHTHAQTQRMSARPGNDCNSHFFFSFLISLLPSAVLLSLSCDREGYGLTGRHGIVVTYEAFAMVFVSMTMQAIKSVADTTQSRELREKRKRVHLCAESVLILIPLTFAIAPLISFGPGGSRWCQARTRLAASPGVSLCPRSTCCSPPPGQLAHTRTCAG